MEDTDTNDGSDVLACNSGKRKLNKRGPTKTRSKIFSYFTFCDETGKWKCQHCRKSFTKASDGGSGNLTNHLRYDHKDLFEEFKSEPASKDKGELSHMEVSPEAVDVYNNDLFQELVVKFIVATDQPFLVVEDQFFQDMIRYAARLEPQIKVPNRKTVREMITKLFLQKKTFLTSILQSNASAISFTLDTWSSKRRYSFMGVTAHFLDSNWKMQNTVLDLILLEGSHTGLNMAQAFGKVLDDFGLWDKFFGLATDNASNMTTMCRHLDKMASERGARFASGNFRVRCMAHIINLSCKAAIGVIDKDDANTEDDNEDFDEELEAPVLGLVVGHSAVSKVRKIVKVFRKSDVFSSMLQRQCTAYDMEYKELIVDVDSRWNSTLKMLQRANELKIPLEATLQKFRKLKDMQLSEGEWSQVVDMIDLLLPFEEATIFMSCENIPKVSDTVIVYNALFNHLEGYCEEKHDTTYKDIEKVDDVGLDSSGTKSSSRVIRPLWLREAATLAWTKLSKYYPSVDGLVYSVATLLDPRYKLEWYVGAQWKQDWIDSCKKAVTTCWESYYKPIENSPASEEIYQASSTKRLSFIESQIRSQLFAVKERNKSDELTKYLSEPIVNSGFLKSTEKFSEISGVLGWWKMNEENYPHLSLMARDFLAVPGTSVPCERLFSAATDLLTFRRQSLLPETIKECMMLKQWLKQFLISDAVECIVQKALGES